MSSNVHTTLEQFLGITRKIKRYNEALGVMYWDLRTGAPRKGAETRSEVIGELSSDMFKLQTSEELGKLIDALSEPGAYEQLKELDRKILAETKKEYDRSKKIPAELYQEYVVLTTHAETLWEDAKHNSDYAMFQPYLEKIIDFNKQFIQLWGQKETPYDTLLDIYEPGMTVAKLDQVFGELRSSIVPLAAAVKNSDHQPDTSMLKHSFEKDRQKEFSHYILGQLGYDFEAGRLDESVHPFATGLNPGDVRITTHYYENDPTIALFGTIHECGHALYEQNISKDLIGTPLSEGTSMGIHESQSRFWENMVGRSKPFWQRYFGELKRLYPEQFHGVEAEDFYRAINVSEPTLIRIFADELTYNLHIMIRYEMEKAIFNEGVAVSDLPALWNAKYREYLGIEPSTDAEGVLQDVHWAGGAFGYFPSYALGNMYAAQMMNTLKKEKPDFDELVREGNLLPVKEWFTERVYQYGKSKTPSEIIRDVTGEELNPSYLVEYLTAKYADIYKL
ncbi:carboxypeptidase M32 [Paenibacillus gansuensis]|uniref:Metal-dependent carboxypeptidase n=1 Tax=Paenibacillus gansuensis TaxID=306542 RepID=A0ABW5PB88_9BACL